MSETGIIRQRGRDLGDWASSSQGFAGLVLVAISTCRISPVLRYALLK